MIKIRIFPALVMLFLSIQVFGQENIKQENGEIIHKVEISKDSLLHQFSRFPSPERFVVQNDKALEWSNNWKHLDSLHLYSITYYSDSLKVKGYMLEPKAAGKYPCIIYNRGGNREFAKLEPRKLAFLTSKLAHSGYVIIASNYRGVDGGEGMEEFGGKDVNDILNLIPVLGNTAKADTSKIGMYGWSRGGMMTYIALTKTDKIKAAAVGGAIADNFETIKDRPVMETNVLSQLIPNYKENKEEEIAKRSAIKWADKFSKDVPILLLHGNADWRVKVEQSLKLAIEFEKYRIPYRLKVYEGADHGINEFKSEVNEDVKNWFDRYLKKEVPLPNMEYHGR